jgi:hypothetical protein
MLERSGDDDLVATHERTLKRVYQDWYDDTIDPETGLVRVHIRGDWVDTIRRPSSTYNNLLALRAYDVATTLGLDVPAPTRQATRSLLESRWTGGHLREHMSSGDDIVADANVPALYLDVLPESNRREIAATIERSGLASPYPIRLRERSSLEHAPGLTRLAASYHATVWVHMGLMYAAGRRKLGLSWRDLVEPLEAAAVRHGTWLETLRHDGAPYLSRFVATEYHFTMSAGLYLELAAGSQASRPAMAPALASA